MRRTWWPGLHPSAALTILRRCATTTCSPWIHARSKQTLKRMPTHMPIVTYGLRPRPRRCVMQPQTAKMSGAIAPAKPKHLASFWEVTSWALLARKNWGTGILVFTRLWKKHLTSRPAKEWRDPGAISSTAWTWWDLPAAALKSLFVRS